MEFFPKTEKFDSAIVSHPILNGDVTTFIVTIITQRADETLGTLSDSSVGNLHGGAGRICHPSWDTQ
jgi:hypothetical protein